MNNTVSILKLGMYLSIYLSTSTDRLKKMGLLVDVLFPNPDIPIGKVNYLKDFNQICWFLKFPFCIWGRDWFQVSGKGYHEDKPEKELKIKGKIIRIGKGNEKGRKGNKAWGIGIKVLMEQ